MKQLFSLFLSMLIIPSLGVSQKSTELTKKLAKYVQSVTTEFNQIPKDRKETLQELGDYIYENSKTNQPAKIIIICTHNSRRSHIGQLWLNAAAIWYGVEDVSVYSGGTEATALNSRAVAVLKRAGFRIKKTRFTDNPVYKVTFTKGAANAPGIIMYSKKYDDSQNPDQDFGAVMVCSEADKSCPTVPGADIRLSVPYDDPRHFDGTASEKLKYDETTRMIAREFFYAMNHAKQKLVTELEKNKIGR